MKCASLAFMKLPILPRMCFSGSLATNPSNCGQVNDKPMIVDFRIDSRYNGYGKSDILEAIYKGDHITR